LGVSVQGKHATVAHCSWSHLFLELPLQLCTLLLPMLHSPIPILSLQFHQLQLPATGRSDQRFDSRVAVRQLGLEFVVLAVQLARDLVQVLETGKLVMCSL